MAAIGDYTLPEISGSLVGDLAAPGLEADGSHGVIGAIVSETASPTMEAIGSYTPESISGDLVASTIGPVFNSSASHGVAGTVSSATVSPAPEISGSIVVATVSPTIAATGTDSVTGKIDIVTNLSSMAAEGQHTPEGNSGAIVGSTMGAAGSHTIPTLSGSLSGNTAPPEMVASGPQATVGTLVASLDPPALQAEAQHSVGGHALAGTLSAILTRPSFQAAGGHTVGVLAGNSASPTLAGEAIFTPPTIAGQLTGQTVGPRLLATAYQGALTA
jgi:hypothetical protein